MKHALPLAALVALAASALAHAQTTTPAPEPGSPGVYRDAAGLAAQLVEAAKKNPTLAVGPILMTDRYTIVEARRTGATPPAAHSGWSELHYITEGSGVMITGGEIVLGPDGKPASIRGGTSQVVKKGDALVVPPGSAHQYFKIDGALTSLEVRFPDPALVKP